jgi:hypothetical protein
MEPPHAQGQGNRLFGASFRCEVAKYADTFPGARTARHTLETGSERDSLV